MELWTSWGSLLRSYAAAHGLNSHQFAIVEFGEDVITVRLGSRWIRFTHAAFETSEGARQRFALHEDGSVSVGEITEEMDFAAERVAREFLFFTGVQQ